MLSIHTTTQESGIVFDKQTYIPPRNINQYSFSNHFKSRLLNPHRYISINTVDKTIENGEIRYNTSDGWRFFRTIDGVGEIVIVGNIEGGDKPVLITGYSKIVDYNNAKQSTRWSDRSLNIIHLTTVLANEDSIKITDIIEETTLNKPFYIEGHKVRIPESHNVMVCTDCGLEATDKNELENNRCSTIRCWNQ